jgi:chaperone required for assembly of F1-ATPase
MTDDRQPAAAPRIVAQQDVTPRPKRFYKAVSVATEAEGFTVHLDGRRARTPGRAGLVIPSEALAESVAAEWDAQAEEINVATMPLTRLANTAIDGVAARMAEVRADIVAYAGSDLLCYRAEHPDGLVASQREAWDHVLGWSEARFGAALVTTQGIMPVAQSDEELAKLDRALAEEPVFPLTAMHIMTTLTGSALLALAVRHGYLDAPAAWAAAHVDEDWQITLWGEDAEATARREARWQEMSAASQIITHLKGPQPPGNPEKA